MMEGNRRWYKFYRRRLHNLRITAKDVIMNIRSVYGQTKIRNKLFIASSTILVIYAVLGLLLMQLVSVQYERDLYTQASSELNLMSLTINRALQGIEQYSFQVSTDNDMQKELVSIDTSKNSYTRYLSSTALQKRLTSYSSERQDISFIKLVSLAGNSFTVGFNGRGVHLSRDQLVQVNRAAGAMVWLLDPTQPGYLLGVREIREENNVTLRDLGMLVIQVDVGVLIDQYLHLTHGEAMIVEKGQQIAYSSLAAIDNKLSALKNKQSDDYTIVWFKHRRYFVTYLDEGYRGFHFYNVVPYNQRFGAITRLRIEMFGLYILIFFLGEWIARRLSMMISRPIEILTNEIRNLQAGKVSLKNARSTGPLGRDEIGSLYEEFHEMLEQMDRLIQENYVKELLVTKTELQALQAQINPHFLYNTLNSINWIARMNNQETISEMIEALGNMFRSMMDRGQTVITLREELSLVNDYLKIQRIRFGERLNTSFHLAEGLEGVSVPKLTIQPIVENSIRHALEKMIEPCYIDITCRRRGDDVFVVVSDNGPGMNPTIVEGILDQQDVDTRTKIGLANIDKRIRGTYGEKYGIVIQSSKSGGTEILLRLPFLQNDALRSENREGV